MSVPTDRHKRAHTHTNRHIQIVRAFMGPQTLFTVAHVSCASIAFCFRSPISDCRCCALVATSANLNLTLPEEGKMLRKKMYILYTYI